MLILLQNKIKRSNLFGSVSTLEKRECNDNAQNSTKLFIGPYWSNYDSTSTTSYDSIHKYIGQEYDEESGQSYLNARYLNNSRGQFSSEDPVFWEGRVKWRAIIKSLLILISSDMKSVFVEKNKFHSLIFLLVLITLQMCLFTQVTSANEFATSTEETVVVPASVVEIEVIEPVIVVESEKLPESVPTNIVSVGEDILDNKDVAQIKIQKEEEFKRAKIEPVDAPLHSSFKRNKTFPFLKLEENKKAIDKPQLPPRTLFRLYGIVAATSTKEVVEVRQEIEPTAENVIEAMGTTTASTSSLYPIVQNTEEIPVTSNTASSTDSILLDIELPVFIKPEDTVELIEDVVTSE